MGFKLESFIPLIPFVSIYPLLQRNEHPAVLCPSPMIAHLWSVLRLLLIRKHLLCPHSESGPRSDAAFFTKASLTYWSLLQCQVALLILFPLQKNPVCPSLHVSPGLLRSKELALGWLETPMLVCWSLGPTSDTNWLLLFGVCHVLAYIMITPFLLYLYVNLHSLT